MPALDIRVHRCNQKEAAWPDLKLDAVLDLDKATIIEAGMGSGEPAVAFHLTNPATGQSYFVQTSAGILEMLMGALKGARDHWAENPVENIWK